MTVRHIITVALLAVLLTACAGPAEPTGPPTITPVIPLPGTTQPPAVDPGAAPVATQPPAVEATPTPATIGPETYPEGVNPLTGLAVPDPAVLERRPLLVKVSNESDQVRPWSGLAFADHVWEYQMEGFAATRFTAVLYAQTPERIGSVRSTRLIDVEHLVDMYGGLLATSGGSSNRSAGGPPRIRELLLAAPWSERVISMDYGFGDPYLVRIPDIPRPGIFSWHTLFAVPQAIWDYAAQEGLNQRQPLTGLAFSETPPPGGVATAEAIVDYPGSGPKHTWRYNATTGRWESLTNDVPDGDMLLPEGQPLAFDNIVIVHAPHYEADFIEDENAQLLSVGVNLIGEGSAVLLRDGLRYDVTWRRSAPEQMMQFFDASGNVIPFKPGQTWFNVASSNIFPPEVTFTP
ncbi:MAG TPA: DUF3048 C-terminal domain-containing protein [Aggregatilineales bacterium]|nr:DUF3048 C-terminal domain-containing protein [Aggregatilineales bacterium]